MLYTESLLLKSGLQLSNAF